MSGCRGKKRKQSQQQQVLNQQTRHDDDKYHRADVLQSLTAPNPHASSAGVPLPPNNNNWWDVFAEEEEEEEEKEQQQQQQHALYVPSTVPDGAGVGAVEDGFLDAIMHVQEPPAVHLGRDIRNFFPNEFHFITGCSGFETLGYNKAFKRLLVEFYTVKVKQDPGQYGAGRPMKVRGDIRDVLSYVQSQVLEEGLRIWSRCVMRNGKSDDEKEQPEVALNSTTWQKFLFLDITDNMGHLVNNLESPMRTALAKARKIVRGRGQLDILVEQFVEEYESESFQECLRRLEKDSITFETIDEWAKTIYLQLRDNPEDGHVRQLNDSRKTCLNLLYSMVDKYDAICRENYPYRLYEEAILHVFGKRRLTRILTFCLPMDRAQALYRMIVFPSKKIKYGMHWYSNYHLLEDTDYARSFPREREEWVSIDSNYEGSGTMNRRLFRLLYSRTFGFQNVRMFAAWSRPTEARFVEAPTGQQQPL